MQVPGQASGEKNAHTGPSTCCTGILALPGAHHQTWWQLNYYVCMHVRACVCACICMWLRAHMCMRLYVRVQVRTYAIVHACASGYTYAIDCVQVHMRLCLRVQACASVYICACMHACECTCICTYVHRYAASTIHYAEHLLI